MDEASNTNTQPDTSEQSQLSSGDSTPQRSPLWYLPILDLATPRGAKIKFSNEHGRNYEREEASKLLNTEDEYTVKRIRIGSWRSKVTLVEFPDEEFNTVMFYNVE